LLDWYREVRRDLPWRRTPDDAYRVWISEIMLQQTRVAAVIPYYEKFLARFPTIAALATAPEQDLLTHWAGLGYYTRARNLQKAAKQMMPSGSFPSTHEEIRALAGIGDYTAAAIASISFGLPHAVVDGNVLRVIARLNNDHSDIALAATRKAIAVQAQALLDTKQPGDYNQAIMELGATVCTPRNPLCGECPVSRWCEARSAGTQAQLPVKVRNGKEERIALDLLWIPRQDGAVLLKPSTRVQGFWDLPERADLPEAVLASTLVQFPHQITFRKYTCRVHAAQIEENDVVAGLRWIAPHDFGKLPLSTIAKKTLRKVIHPLPLRTISA
jgi:A/G-specific adenine glycosylase